MISTSERIYRHALKDSGLTEVPGSGSNPRIKLAIVSAASWLDPDDSATAWCGCIRGLWAFETATGVPAQHYRARNWMNWGSEVLIENAALGDTVILSRAGGHHVALFEEWNGLDMVQLFGGNQSNSTNSKVFRLSTVVAVRRSFA